MNSHFNLHKYSEENVYPPMLQVWLYAYVMYCNADDKTATIPMKIWKETHVYIPCKGRDVLLNTMNVYGGIEIWLHLSLTLTVDDGGKRSA
jgi:hypothetical protein